MIFVAMLAKGAVDLTNAELSRLYKVRREIERLEDEIDLLENPSLTQQLTGMPHASGTTDKVGNAALRLASLRLKLEAARLDALDELETLTAYIESIEDPLIKSIMQYRHMNGLPWERVADMIGNGITGETCRRYHWQYLHDENLK